MSATIIDDINITEMRKHSSVHHYTLDEGLTAAEKAALARVMDSVRGQRILDMGVGGGRTVEPLLQISKDYIGIDNSEPMLQAVTRRFPGVDFQFADARDLKNIPDGSIRMAVFSCCGIGMVSHDDRLRILREVYRTLQPGGLFLFSTHNRNCPDESAGLAFPLLQFSPNPVRMLVRSARFCAHTLLRIYRRAKLRRFEIRTDEYSIVNDRCHDYGVMLYYITLANQRKQLEQIGFEAAAEAFDEKGRVIVQETDESSIMLIARKPAR